jgi:signal peptidase I
MRKLFKTILLVSLLILQLYFLKVYVLGFYKIDSESMKPNLVIGNILIISKIGYSNWDLFNQDIKKDEIYLFKKDGNTLVKRAVNIKKDSTYLLGDNQSDSYDSKEFGYVSNDSIIGKVAFKL